MKSMNRKNRKRIARLFKRELCLAKIPSCRKEIINNLSKELEYMYSFERHSVW